MSNSDRDVAETRLSFIGSICQLHACELAKIARVLLRENKLDAGTEKTAADFLRAHDASHGQFSDPRRI